MKRNEMTKTTETKSNETKWPKQLKQDKMK